MNVSDKETRAVFLNFKELRGLEKNVQALDIEQAYSISIINLNQKLMKVNYKKLKDKVSRIRSHLGNGVIENLKELESDGKLQFEHSASRVDFNIRIEAAAKRLKLQNRAKSALPRLESSRSKRMGTQSRVSSSAHFIQTPRRTTFQTSDRTSPAPSSCNPMIMENGQRKKSPCRANVNIVVDAVPDTSFTVPRSMRADRRKSIDIRCISEIAAAEKEPLEVVESHRSRSGSISMLSVENGIRPSSRRPSFSNCQAAIKLLNISDATVGSEKDLQVTISSQLLPNAHESATKETRSSSNTLSPLANSKNGSAKIDNNKLRPMSVPASKVAVMDGGTKQKRPVTAAQLAVEARKKSTADIQRVSKMLAEGKTRVPFSSHDLKAMELKSKVVKPFRSIREGTFNVGIDRDVVDNTLGDDLHNEMKKGLILGEVATSLVLEDKIDHFLDRVDTYVKDNPNYTYDAERTKAELKAIRDANKAQKAKKPKRNKLRRRQLQRRLQEENAMAEAAKSRYLRVDDEELDTSNVNTLAIDQMRMLKNLRCFDNDSD